MNYTEAVVQKFERLRARLAAVEAERDAARAGEARAVEALEAEQRAAHWRNLARITDKHEDALEAGRLSEIAQRLRHGIVLVLTNNQPALDWLAQREREAAAEVWKTAIMLACGCHDYGGGHFGEKYQAFQHGIDTVISVLEAKRDGDDSLQIKVVEHVGAAALRARKEVGE